ncbi:MAG: hypothetical protein EBR02_07365 [Alphaproteobacteria bacterium]|nr:hypothetical protein [Alphaproteobacteria bacterium]
MKNNEEIRKITVNLPVSLIDPLLKSGDLSLTETIKQALKEYRNRQAWKALSELRGKVKFDLTYEQIKEDRE